MPDMASPLPSPGQLLLENITLLSPTPTYFQDRYGYSLSSTTFVKPGNIAEANAVLHFLLSNIDPDQIEPLFRPCFPIHDREQERDFRRVVDSRLAILEKSKLLSVGVARKSVVSSAGGDRFLDLIWGLSNIALQQVCLRQPPYGPASRLQVTSQNFRSDSLSHNAPSRSHWSLLSAASSRSERHLPDAQTQKPGRRFLSVGSLTASQQRARDAELIRARIDAERTALERTTDLAKKGANTWAKEADSLREKIGHFEAKLARLKSQLADMGFDEHGNDVRKKIRGEDTLVRPVKEPQSRRPLDPVNNGFSTSPSQDDLGEGLKTSPFDSAESGSSVDEVPEPSDGGPDLASDLSRILTFAADTADLRNRVDRSLPTGNSTLQDAACVDETSSSRAAEATDIVNLVRAAADELEEATNRMDQIKLKSISAESAVESIGKKETPSRTRAVRHPASPLSLASTSGRPADSPKKVFSDVANGRALVDRKESMKLARADTKQLMKVNSSSVSSRTTSFPIEVHHGDQKSASESKHGSPSDKAAGTVRRNSVSQRAKESLASSAITHDRQTDSPCQNASESQKLKDFAKDSDKRHKGIIDACSQLQEGAVSLSTEAQKAAEVLGMEGKRTVCPRKGPSLSMDGGLLAEVVARKSSDEGSELVDGDASDTVSEGCKDIETASKALRGRHFADRKLKTDMLTSRRRREYATRSLDSISLPSPKTLDLSPRYDTDVHCGVQTLDQTSKRSVRFAELPPSYSRSRGGPVGVAFNRQECFVRQSTEVHPRSSQAGRSSIAPKSVDNINSKAVDGRRNTDNRNVLMKSVDGPSCKRALSRGHVDNSRSMGSSGQKPPRLERRQTPHRIVRVKDASCPGSRTASPQSKRQSMTNIAARSSMQDIGRISEASSRARGLLTNGDDIDRVGKEIADAEVLSLDGEEHLGRPSVSMPEFTVTSRNAVPSVEAQSKVLATLEPTPSVVEASSIDQNDSTVSSFNDKPDSSNDDRSEGAICDGRDGYGASESGSKDIIRKELSETALHSSSECSERQMVVHEKYEKGFRSVGKVFRKNGLLRLSSVSMRGSVGSPKGRSLSMSSRESQESRSSTLNMSADNIDKVSARLSPQNGQHRGSNGRVGFFAGETAQWQENVRLQSTCDGIGEAENSRRGSVEGTSRNSRVNSGAGGRISVVSGTSQGVSRKSRVQTFRARLAALSRD